MRKLRFMITFNAILFTKLSLSAIGIRIGALDKALRYLIYGKV